MHRRSCFALSFGQQLNFIIHGEKTIIVIIFQCNMRLKKITVRPSLEFQIVGSQQNLLPKSRSANSNVHKHVKQALYNK